MDTFRKMRAEKGFTLIELLVVIAIIGILAAIAIPQFASYRRRGYDAAVKADLKNAATAQEAYFVDNDIYSGSPGSLVGYNQSANVDMAAAATVSTFILTATAASGCGSGTGAFTLSSTTGDIVGTACN